MPLTNQGAGGIYAGSWVDRVYFSTNEVWDEADTPLGTYWNSGKSLASGERYACTNTVTLPNVSGGTYYLLFKTDAYNNYIEESVETNNVSEAIPVTLVLPDLAPVSLSTEGVAQAGRLLTVTYAVTNQDAGEAASDYG